MAQNNNPLEKLFNETECAVGIKERGDGHCFANEHSKKIINYLEKKGEKDVKENNLFSKLKKATKCETNRCISETALIKDIIGDDQAQDHIKYKLKVNGPTDKTTWLNNYNIDNILEQLTKTFNGDNKFIYIKFQMSDFNTKNTELATIDLVAKYKEGMRTFGVVLNDDVSTGNGTHWTAMFCDFRDPANATIEHFNSSGKGTMASFDQWMVDTKTKFEKDTDLKVKIVHVSYIQHQHDNASCGPYSLYYIISRLNKIDYNIFMNSKSTIKDAVMWDFRKVLFD